MPNQIVNHTSLSLRPITEADHPFLLALYYSTRAAELEPLAWNDEQKQQFVAMQFQAQYQHYKTHYPNAAFDIVSYKDEAIGRLYVEEWPDEFRVVDIALLPEYCQRGIGSWLLRGVMQKASTAGKGASIHVEQHNPALRLYERLGFVKTGEHGIYYLMVWSAV